MEYHSLVPELKDWDARNGGQMSPAGWASCEGSYSLAVAYAWLLWPRFVELHGMVFREGVSEAQVVNRMNVWDDLTQVERVINHLHVFDIQHPGAWADANAMQIRYLGATLRDAWAAKLLSDFPDKRFVVDLIEGDDAHPLDCQVVFYQPRRESDRA